MTARRGFTIVELEDGQTYAWGRCEITNCPNNVCLRMSKSLCYPHGIEFGEFTEAQFEAERKAYHGNK